MIYSYVNTNNEATEENAINSEVLFNAEEYVHEDVLLKGTEAKGGKKASKLGNLKIEVDRGETDYDFSRNNAYFKAIKDGKIIRLNLANNCYQKHSDPTHKPWEGTISADDLDDINLALSLKCTNQNYSDMTVYDAAVFMYKKYYDLDLDLTIKDKPVYKYSTLKQSESVHKKKGK